MGKTLAGGHATGAIIILHTIVYETYKQTLWLCQEKSDKTLLFRVKGAEKEPL